MNVRNILAVAAACAIVSACAAGSSAPVLRSSPTPTVSPTPVSTMVAAGPGCKRSLGTTVSFASASGALALRVITGKPKVVDHALASYAHSPANGHYLIVDVTLTNMSDSGLRLDPSDFVFTTSSGKKLTVDSGNEPYSGAGH